MNLKERLTPGTWILFEYGYENREFCVLQVAGDQVLLGTDSWLVSSAQWMSISSLEHKSGTILGKGKYRWYRNLLPFIKDGIFPYTSVRAK